MIFTTSQQRIDRLAAIEVCHQVFADMQGHAPKELYEDGYADACAKCAERIEKLPSTETPKEVMPAATTQPAIDAPPQPAPSPAGAMELNEQERHNVGHAQYLVDQASPDNPEVCFDYTLIASLLNLITRLRSAPPVTEEMVERANAKLRDGYGIWMSAVAMRAALTAALTPASGTQP